ncbi:type IV pilus inner membrane component PilO [Marinicella gelatinilytica]|uniref:type 4a pilus biogenesis protein PilO n=1 Tax=Marinicella gelatinilytica TaxID=2996017 RepID=UPI002260B290|nr:type 4a pilus biogenesis protein PilO [Marinicella gelatinilytica]MCX7544673.1 type 4a pilus biogenesis protein PilO [Marinicella gelatinilytica]
MSFIDDLQSLDYSNPGGWSKSIKIGAVVLVAVVILAAGYWFSIKAKQENLKSLQRTEVDLKNTYEVKYQKAAQLEAYEAQLKEMEIILQSMLRQLPSKNEMSDLIVDVSQTALASGIENELFEPGAETLKGFYAEKPITLRMKGNYHQFGNFVSGVASLPRVVILTMHDISLKPIGEATQGGRLILEGTAKTYRYLDDNEMQTQTDSTGGGQ